MFTFNILLTLRHAAALRLERDANMAISYLRRGGPVFESFLELAEEDMEAWLAVRGALRVKHGV